MWGTQVRSLIQEDSTCRRAIKPVPRKSWSRSLEPGSTATEATCRSWWSPPAPEPLLLCFVWESVVAGLDGGRGEEVGSVPGGSCVCLSHFSHVWLFATLWTVACQAPLSMEILQARILECVAITSSRESSQPRDWASLSYVSCIGRQALYHSLFFFDWCSSNSEDCPYTGFMIYGPPTSVSCTPSTFWIYGFLICWYEGTVKDLRVSRCRCLEGMMVPCCCSVTQSCPALHDPWTLAYEASLSFTISRVCSS